MKEFSARRGVEYVKTARSQSLRSIPRKQQGDYSYLDLYILDREKERLEGELSYSGKRSERTRKRLEKVKLKMEKLKERLGDTKKNEKKKVKETVSETNPKKDWKIMNVDY
jgi:uncharacterized membrane-anchored protein